nr:Toll-like receptor 11 [Arenicola marina]
MACPLRRVDILFATLFIAMIVNAITAETGDVTNTRDFGIASVYYTQTWHFPSNPWNRCLVEARNGSDFRVICTEKLSDPDLYDVVRFWRDRRSEITHLSLSCSGTQNPETGSGDKDRCYCFDVRIMSEGPGVGDDHLETIQIHTCGYPEELTKDMVRGLSGLRVLELFDVGISAIANDTLRELSGNLQLLNISRTHVKLRDLPHGLFCGLENLIIVHFARDESFNGNQDVFPAHAFDCSNNSMQPLPLEALLVLGYDIGVLPQDSLVGATNLQLLYVESCNASNIHPDSLAGLRNLKELSLRYNKIAAIPRGTFRDLQSLNLMVISGNELTIVDTEIFRSLPVMQMLSLSNNNISVFNGSFSAGVAIVYLYLDNNRLTELSPPMFTYMSLLAKLYLGHNEIQYIHPATFRSTPFLQSLNLESNRLWNATNLRDAFHKTLERLGYIGLANNSLEELVEDNFYAPPWHTSLRLMDLSFNRISNISANAFRHLFGLRILQMRGNPVEEILPGTFNNLALASLWIDQTNLRRVPADMISDTVVYLSLSDNYLSEFPVFTKPYPALQAIYIGYTNISSVTRPQLENVSSLTTLNLTHCSLTHLEAYTFANLTNLQTLDLSNNLLNLNFSQDFLGKNFRIKLLHLNGNAISSAENLFLHHIKYVDILDLSNNPLGVFPDQPKTDPRSGLANVIGTTRFFMRNCSLTYINPLAFDLMADLDLLDIRDNDLEELQPLLIGVTSENFFVLLDGNPLLCSCRMAWLKDATYAGLYRLNACRLVTSGDIVPFEQVETDEFLCEDNRNCLVAASECTCYTNDVTTHAIVNVDCSRRHLTRIPRNIPATTRVVNLQGNHFPDISFNPFTSAMQTTKLLLQDCAIDSLPINGFRMFPNLDILRLDSNNVRELSKDSLSGLYRLRVLNFTSNSIERIQPGSFGHLNNMEEFHLADNNLSVVHNATMEEISTMPYLETLTLANNPWECQCDNLTFKQWIQGHSNIIPNLAGVACNGTSVLKVPDEEFLCYDLRRTITEYHIGLVSATSACAVVILLALISVLVGYKHREILAALIYHKFGWRFSLEEDESCPYDTYVCYDRTNMTVVLWVKNELIPRCEPELKLYVPDRDSQPGAVEADEIVQRLEQSKRSIFLLTEGALAHGDQLLYTFQMAYHRATLEHSRHRIILAVMDDAERVTVLDDPSADPHLQAFLQTKNYINYPGKKFWEKLFFYLPASNGPEEDQVDGGDDDVVVRDHDDSKLPPDKAQREGIENNVHINPSYSNVV